MSLTQCRRRNLGSLARASILGLSSLACGSSEAPQPGLSAVSCAGLSDPFQTIGVLPNLVEAPDGGVLRVVLAFWAPYVSDLQIDAVRVQSGSLVEVTDITPIGSRQGDQFRVTIAPDASPSTMLVDVDLRCAGATRTRHYRITNGTTSAPNDASMSTEFVSVEELFPI